MYRESLILYMAADNIIAKNYDALKSILSGWNFYIPEIYILNSLHAEKYSCWCYRLLNFFKLFFSKNYFRNHYQSVKRF